jgi:Amt family ammonium transporter
VGATSVHLVCGVFGTLAVGLFAQDQFSPNTTGDGLFFGGGLKLFLAQLVGVVAVGVFVVVASLVFWGVIKAAMGIRVPAEEEMEGLDVGEHGISAYPDFHAAGAYGSPVAAGMASRAAAVGAPVPERSL